MTPQLLETDIRVQLHRGLLVILTHLRRDQYDAVRGLRTINSRRCRVFQHGDTLNIIGIDLAELTFHAIDNHQRVRVIHRSPTTDTQLRPVIARLAGVLTDPYTRHLSGKGLRGIRDRTVGQLLVELHRRDRTGQVHFLLRSITHDDYLVQGLRIFSQTYIKGGLPFYRHRCRRKPNIRKLEHGIVGDLQRELAVEVGDRAVGGTALHDIRADDGLAFRVDHDTRHLLPLLGSRDTLRAFLEQINLPVTHLVGQGGAFHNPIQYVSQFRVRKMDAHTTVQVDHLIAIRHAQSRLLRNSRQHFLHARVVQRDGDTLGGSRGRGTQQRYN